MDKRQTTTTPDWAFQVVRDAFAELATEAGQVEQARVYRLEDFDEMPALQAAVRAIGLAIERGHVSERPVCAARKQGSAGGNAPADCSWPTCGCDPRADQVIVALQGSGHLSGAPETETPLSGVGVEGLVEALIEAARHDGWTEWFFLDTEMESPRKDKNGLDVANARIALLAAIRPRGGEEGLTLTALHAANKARQTEWCAGGDPEPDLAFRGNELAGEVGEACNVIKKLERERRGWRGSRATKDQLAQELADVVICADLCAVTAGIDLDAAVVAKFNATSEANGLSTKLPTPRPSQGGTGDA